MNKSHFLFLSFLFCACHAALFAQKGTKPVYLQHTVPNSELPNIKSKFDRFKQQIMGHFSNLRQVQAHPELGEKHQEFIIIPIFQERANEFWIYLEFFSPSMPEQPLDQRIEQYVRVNRDSLRMEVYYLKEPDKYINEWKKPMPFQGLTKNDLVTREATCDLYIVEKQDAPYTQETVLPAQIDCVLKGSKGTSKFVTLWFELSDRGYDMQFRFYDANKTLLREGHVIEFDRLNYAAKGYTNYAPDVKIKPAPKTKKTKAPKKE